MWIQQVTELAFRLVEVGIPLDALPLTIEEATEVLALRLARAHWHGPSPAVDSLEAEPAVEVRRLSSRYPSGPQALC